MRTCISTACLRGEELSDKPRVAVASYLVSTRNKSVVCAILSRSSPAISRPQALHRRARITATSMASLRLVHCAAVLRTLEVSNRSFPLAAYLPASAACRATISTLNGTSNGPFQSPNCRAAFSCSATSGDAGETVDVADLAVRARLRLEPTEVSEGGCGMARRVWCVFNAKRNDEYRRWASRGGRAATSSD